MLRRADNVDGVMIDQAHGGGVGQSDAQQDADELRLAGMASSAERGEASEHVGGREIGQKHVAD